MLSSPAARSLTAVLNGNVFLQCPTTKYPCSAQPQSIPAVPKHQVSLQCPAAGYPCSAQPQSIPAVPNRRVSLQCPTAEYPCSAQPPSIHAVPNRRVSPVFQETLHLHLLSSKSFRVGMLEVNTFLFCRTLSPLLAI